MSLMMGLPQGSFVLERKFGDIAPTTEFICTWTPEEPLARGLAGSINVGVATKEIPLAESVKLRMLS